MATSTQPMNTRRRATARRGITLVEMLVSVALLVLMMTIIVQVFAKATGAVSTAKAYAEIDQSFRKLSSTIRKDLEGVTARFTPPLDPNDGLGYFEYGENSFADLQGEDCDDYMRFTVKAPEGELFTGRIFAQSPYATGVATQAQNNIYLNSQPITVTSQYAEVIYFLRNNNLYRRVLLIAPERQNTIARQPPDVVAGNPPSAFFTAKPFVLGYTNGVPSALQTSWQGMNDLSARPASTAINSSAGSSIILNSLGDLTNRENRFSYPRFHSDIAALLGGTVNVTNGDGVPDDFNSYKDPVTMNVVITGDGVPDYYPTLYPEVFSNTGLINEFSVSPLRVGMSPSGLAFPFIFPGAYSRPDPNSVGVGWIHSPDPGNPQNTLSFLNALNHNPLDFGDSLPVPSVFSTWWGFPTWRETMSTNWTDPSRPLGPASGFPQEDFLIPVHDSNKVPSFPANDMLPPMTNGVIPNSSYGRLFRVTPQPFNDGAGEANLAFSNLGNLPNTEADSVWFRCWEDDLLATGVRSFDIKAYDAAFGGYVDLGWGDDLRLYSAGNNIPASPPFLAFTPIYPFGSFEWPVGSSRFFDMVNQTFAHEGRIPPLVADHRLDAQYPVPYDPNNPGHPYAGYNNYTGNIGDDTSTVVRLRRVWDSWSTEYTQAPAIGINPQTKQPVGPSNFTPPVYPSYPPPYPAPLRGIRIQLRVVDPKNEHVKSLTIIQDFTDKL